MAAAGAVAVALLWPCVALVRGTTAHDWYAAVKLTVTEAMIAVGFNSFEPTRCPWIGSLLLPPSCR